MKRSDNFLKVISLLAAYALIFAPKAEAYLDPGTGSFLFQIIAASLLTFLVSARKVKVFLSGLVRKIFPPKKSRSDD